jgi:hypothetical protein
MAYSSSTRRGSYRTAPPPKSSNAVALVIAAVVVVGLVVAVVAMSGGSKPAAPPPTATVKTTPTVAAAPVAPATKPYPEMPSAKIAEAKRLADSFADDARRGDALYAESLKAKQAGDDAAWQKKLGEAKQLYETIKDKWNDFVDGLPSNKDHDTEDVLRHYFQRESGQVQAYIKKLANMKSDERIR